MENSIMAYRIIILCFMILFSLSASGQTLILDEAVKAQNWNGSERARVGGTAFVSVGNKGAIALRVVLPLGGDGPRWATLALTHTNWSGFATLRIRALPRELSSRRWISRSPTKPAAASSPRSRSPSAHRVGTIST